MDDTRVELSGPGGVIFEGTSDEFSKLADKVSRGRHVGGIAADQLRSLIERIERLEEEKKGLADDIRDIYAEAKGNGFDPKIMREVIRLRKMERADRVERQLLLDLYWDAIEG